MIALGIAVEKVRLLRDQPTSIAESRVLAGLSAEELAGVVRGRLHDNKELSSVSRPEKTSKQADEDPPDPKPVHSALIASGRTH